jgi:dTDP-4-dehydrorhamnose reductase
LSAGAVRVLLFGANGQLGSELRRWLPRAGIELVVPPRDAADFLQPSCLPALIEQHRPDVVINAAAYTAVDQAESEPGRCLTINGEAPGLIAQACRRLDATLIHFSTDYVFDGSKAGAYTEQDPPHPVSAYGRSKWAGEQAIAAAGARALVLRVAWLYGLDGHNFVKTMLRLSVERDALRVVNDQWGAPTWVRTIAQWLPTVLTSGGEGAPARHQRHPGVYHVAPSGRCTWYETARTVLSVAADHPVHRSVMKVLPAAVQPIHTKDYPAKAMRPANSQLDSTKACSLLSWPAPHWQHELVACTRLLLDQSAG